MATILKYTLAFTMGMFLAHLGYSIFTWQFWVAIVIFFGYSIAAKASTR